MLPRGELAVFDEERLSAGGGDKFAELGARELEERGRLGAAPALKKGEHGQEFGRGRGGEVELHAQRHGVAHKGGDQVGRQVEAEHDCRKGRNPGIK